MPDTNLRHPDTSSREADHLQELERMTTDPKVLAGEVAGTSEETARLFNSGHTLAEDRTGPAEEG